VRLGRREKWMWDFGGKGSLRCEDNIEIDIKIYRMGGRGLP
jgi:hypothetical protein